MSARAITFPNYTQIPSRIPVRVWHAMRAGSIVGALAIAALLLVAPDAGLFVMWKVVIPLLPLLFLTVPGLWRNLCPLAASNQTPRALKLTKALTAPNWLKEYGYVIAFGLFIAFVVLRKLGLDDSGPYSALLLLGAMAAAFTGGMFLKGKSGWCSTICPLLPVQRIYGQTPLMLVANAHCQPCVGCVKNCYDFNPRAAYLADLHDSDNYWAGYRKYFVGAFPGLVLGFFAVPVEQMALTTAVSLALFATLTTFYKTSAHTITTLFGAIAFSIFYWYAAEIVGLEPLTWALRAAAIALAATWFVRTLRKEKPFLEKAGAAPAAAAAPSAAPAGLTRASGLRAIGPQVTFVPDNKRVAPKPGQSLLEIAEANNLPIEAGCRMGICGADPVAIKDGMSCTSPIGDDEKATLERLGYAENTRMACCVRVTGPVTVQLTPDKASAPRISQIQDFSYDKSIERVVVIGNGIAGVTAADHLRRRHPATNIDLIAEEPHHLYNRMGISRLVYGRSAMQGLYLNPDKWYDERAITTWLNTRALWIDRANREVALGTGEKLPYDRLILATGSRSLVPKIDGFGAPGTGVLRTAADAMALRAYAQRVSSTRGVIAGGGLLGLEAAYALHKLGLKTTVLERGPGLLRRQLDDRGGELLKAYLEGLGLEIVLNAEVQSVDANGRLRALDLKDGRRLPAHILLVAAGIQPNVELARDARLAINRGVLVDDRMRTGDPAILAAGDIAEFGGQTPGLWPTAVAQAEIAAENAVGGDKPYVPAPPVTMLKVVGVELASIGRIHEQPEDEAIVHEAHGGYRKLVISGDRIVGAILLGPGNDVAAVRTAITKGYDVSGQLGALRQGRLDGLAQGALVPAAVA
ncbi:FAD-dependent oxidoreductase [Solirubrobacter sp. CPCC 204708]|uniref:FAD-dependent oxidoreductase n=1 Tax=Solirubrobacter deserti TaxID=2282478 RepID=A0ABT4RU77_9ACTN|nr:FAD-dependent oxidoreductase [Solirubrobacter deserti]MBE2316332.1 FAD-dependent oxidoreductase [Solirubrobacter deserti]MDA0142136.1 FAD-dependent oxidoreductase [Solirubrobacter deserti]